MCEFLALLISFVFSTTIAYFFQIAETYDLREKSLNKCIAVTQEKLTSAKAKGAGHEIRPLQLSVSARHLVIKGCYLYTIF